MYHCCSLNPVPFSFITYHPMFLHGDNMADVHNGTRTVYHTLSTLPVFNGRGSCCSIFVFCVVFCTPICFFFVFFLLFLFYNIVSVLFEIEIFIMRDVIYDHDSGVIYRQFKVINIFDIVF